MTEEQDQMLRRTHDFWFQPTTEGGKSRAAQVDEILTTVRAGKIGSRTLFWLAAVVVAVGTIWAQMKGFKE